MKRKISSSKGFSLIEYVVGISLSAGLMVLLFSLGVLFEQARRNVERRVEQFENTGIAMERLLRDVKGSSQLGGPPTASSFILTSSTGGVVHYEWKQEKLLRNGNSLTVPGVLQEIQFSYPLDGFVAVDMKGDADFILTGGAAVRK